MNLTNAPRYRRWLLIALTALLGYRLLLMGVLAEQGVGLHVDEAQYWWWSRDLQWGYFSKPPGIAALIHVSTAIWGDSVTGVRALAVACWVGTAGLLWAIGRSMQRERAGLWAAVLLSASIASNWLGMVATTDALLMPGWALLMWLTWQAQCRPGAGWWLAAGAVLGLTLLGKYTAGAIVLTWLWFWWRGSPAPADTQGLSLKALAWASLAALVTFAPHVLWNALNDWPTLRHTAEITLQGGAAAPSDSARTLADRALSLAEFGAGQFLLAGPALCAVLALVLIRHPARAWLADPRVRWSLTFAWPLLAIGALQAVHSKAQINWALPMLLGLCLAGGLWLDQMRARWAPWLTLAALTVGMTSAISLHGDARLWQAPQWQPGAPDIWGRMRGWGSAFEQLTPALRQQPPSVPVVTADRTVLAQALYAWRDEGRDFRSWSPTGAVRHHYDWKLPLAGNSPAAAASAPCVVLFVDEEVPQALQQAARVEALAQARSGRVHLVLWRLQREPVHDACEWPVNPGRAP